MKNSNRVIKAAILVLAWIVSIIFARTFLVPEIGAATVMQLDTSNTGYIAAMGFSSVVSLATLVISLVFALLIYLVLRSKQ